jgi:hypothetical protein
MPASQQPFRMIDKYACAVRTQDEVAQIMTGRGFPMNRAAVWHIERRALAKLREGLREFYRQQFLADSQ